MRDSGFQKISKHEKIIFAIVGITVAIVLAILNILLLIVFFNVDMFTFSQRSRFYILAACPITILEGFLVLWLFDRIWTVFKKNTSHSGQQSENDESNFTQDK